MRRILLLLILLVVLVPGTAGEPPVVACDTDTDCEIKNPWICGGPYERPCDFNR